MRTSAVVLIVALAICTSAYLIADNYSTGSTDITYIDEFGVEKTVSISDCIPLTSSGDVLSAEWYVVSGNVTFSRSILVLGDVKIILRSDANLTCVISVTEGYSLTIYAELSEDGKVGKLNAHSRNDNPAIGGFDDTIGGIATGNITICGGEINASATFSAAIGGRGSNSPGDGFGGGNIKITGGTVTAISEESAGIGDGKNGSGGTFSTGDNGNAVIIASSISDQTNKDNWHGAIIEGDTGKVYGGDVTPKYPFTIPEGKTLAVDQGNSFGIEKLTFDSSGRIDLKGGGRLRDTDNIPDDIILKFKLTMNMIDSSTSPFAYLFDQKENYRVPKITNIDIPEVYIISCGGIELVQNTDYTWNSNTNELIILKRGIIGNLNAVGTSRSVHTVTLTGDEGISKFTYIVNGGEETEYAGPFRVVHNYSLTVNAQLKEGKELVKWNDNTTTSTWSTSSVTDNINLSAETKTVVYTVTLTGDEGVSKFVYKIGEADEVDYTVPFEVDHGSRLVLRAVPENGKEFVKWSDNTATPGLIVDPVTSNLTLSAETKTVVYTVSWKNWDGTLLSEDMVEYGIIPAYTGDQPVRPSTSRYSYSFSGWNPSPAMVTEDATYTAQFLSSVNRYTVTFFTNDSEAGLVSQTSISGIPYGSEIIVDGSTVTIRGTTVTAYTSDSNDQYTYAFSGWSVPLSGKITKNTVITANFEKTLREYAVTWMNWNGSLFYEEFLGYGTTPVYAGDEPSRPADAQYTYTFTGWRPTVQPVTGNSVYIADYSRSLNSHTVYFRADMDDCGTVSMSSIQDIPYGSRVIVDGSTVTIRGITVTAHPSETNDQYTYSFIGWTFPDSATTGLDTVIVANFEKSVRSYTVTWIDWDGTVLFRDTVDYGVTPVFEPLELTRVGDEFEFHTFIGWDPVPSQVTGDASYTAQYITSPRTYTVFTNPGTGASPSLARDDVSWTDRVLTGIPDPGREGYVFNEWTYGGVPVGESTYGSLATDGRESITILATWYMIPSIIQVGDGTWIKGSTESLHFAINVPMSELKQVLVNGDVLDEVYYEILGESNISLKDTYLETLSVGDCIISVRASGGEATAGFTVSEPVSGKDDKIPWWVIVFIILIPVVFLLLLAARRKKT